VRKLPRELRRSLTWDRGKEMADHKNFTIAANAQVDGSKALFTSVAAKLQLSERFHRPSSI
jgi:hypothetical protein